MATVKPGSSAGIALDPKCARSIVLYFVDRMGAPKQPTKWTVAPYRLPALVVVNGGTDNTFVLEFITRKVARGGTEARRIRFPGGPG